MADGIPPTTGGMDAAPQPAPEPPPLDSIRVKAAGARGLNKPAILAAAGLGLGAVLVLASGAFTGNDARKPADVKPLMSDPARPEIASSALRQLPIDYAQAGALSPPPEPPQLGPPLPGDVAAFAAPRPILRGYADDAEPDAYDAASYRPVEVDPQQALIEQAEKAGLFFSLREEPRQTAHQVASEPAPQLSPGPTPIPQAPLAPQDPAGSEHAIFPGAVISASLITELDSESPGPVVAQITQSVYDGATGRILLIPQGAKLIGAYRSSTRYGQSRVAIAWSRLIMPDGTERSLDEIAVDPSGASGVSGSVDNHWADVLGASALGTFINVGVATTEEPQISYGGLGIIGRDPVDAAIAEGVQRSSTAITNRVVDRGLAIPPTIRIEAGKRVAIICTRRLPLPRVV